MSLPAWAAFTHHGAIGLHVGIIRVGVLGVDGHHHLGASLMPVKATRHLLLVLRRRRRKARGQGSM